MSNSSQFRGGIKLIQRGVATVTSSTVATTVTISTVNTSKSELRLLGGVGFDINSTIILPRLVLTNSTTITMSPAGGSAVISASFPVSWELTEWY
jgi:hypothetical protein